MFNKVKLSKGVPSGGGLDVAAVPHTIRSLRYRSLNSIIRSGSKGIISAVCYCGTPKKMYRYVMIFNPAYFSAVRPFVRRPLRIPLLCCPEHRRYVHGPGLCCCPSERRILPEPCFCGLRVRSATLSHRLPTSICIRNEAFHRG